MLKLLLKHISIKENIPSLRFGNVDAASCFAIEL